MFGCSASSLCDALLAIANCLVHVLADQGQHCSIRGVPDPAIESTRVRRHHAAAAAREPGTANPVTWPAAGHMLMRVTFMRHPGPLLLFYTCPPLFAWALADAHLGLA